MADIRVVGNYFSDPITFLGDNVMGIMKYGYIGADEGGGGLRGIYYTGCGGGVAEYVRRGHIVAVRGWYSPGAYIQ